MCDVNVNMTYKRGPQRGGPKGGNAALQYSGYATLTRFLVAKETIQRVLT